MTRSKSKLSPSFAWLLLLALGASQPALALQVVDARDGETVLAKVSRKEVTRISVDRGRIRKVTGNAGEFVLEKDDEKGQVFIRPVSPDSTKPINLFVSTERSTIGLLLQPVDTPSDAIVIREAGDAASGPARIERSGRHVRTMKNLLLAMAEDALPDFNRPYSIYSTLADKEGNIWFGTQEKGVCCYNGNTFTYYTENGLDKAAVRTLFQHRDGTLWAGNNGAGLFRFNGKTFDNFTEAHHLGNPEFLAKLPPREGTLGRPWTLEQDSAGLLWIGTIDAGVWTFDGTQLTHYTTQHGLAGNSIWKIYKDNTGALWFIVNGEALCRFNGQRFSTFVF